jgi:competence protein ComFC
MPSEKSPSATPFCKVCFQAVNSWNWRTLFGDSIPLCGDCLREMNPHLHQWTLRCKGYKVPVRSAYLYNEKIRSMLFQFKGCADIELAPLFLGYQAPILHLIYHGYTLIPAPSFAEKNEARGFNHVELMFSPLRLPFLHPLIKVDDVKQANLHWGDRQKIGQHLRYDESVDIRGKKILFVDDLFTTGATAKACVELLRKHGAKHLQILVMGYTPEKKAKEADAEQPN